jgi:uncharacterized membrane protein
MWKILGEVSSIFFAFFRITDWCVNRLLSCSADGVRRVRDFVEKGGGYLGLCAGAYFAASSIEFEKGSSLGN